MSGAAFPITGSIGPAAQTVWFGAIPDRLNMLVGMNGSNPLNASNTSVSPAHYGNLWFPFRSSFGAFTTAPDGTTNTAQLLSEDTSNNTHFIQAGSLPYGHDNATGALSAGYALGRIRIAGFFKQSGRRLGFSVQTFDGGASNAGKLTVVFDLVGGQVGVAASTSGIAAGTILNPIATQIIPVANGFYLCIQDLYFKDGGGAMLLANCFLDNGTGTGALSNSYTGDGASGVYCWRTNAMPSAAYSISNTIFFDDFLNSSTIDLNNTKVSGFNWYPSAGKWTNYINDTGSPYPSSAFSVSGSVLTLLPPDAHGAGGTMLGTATQISDVGGTYVGQGFGGGKPMLLEGKLNFNYAVQESANCTGTWWSSSLEWIVAQGQGQTVALASQAKFPGMELDLVEAASSSGHKNRPDTDALTYIGVSGSFGLPGNGAVQTLTGNFVCMVGFPPWNSTYDYGLVGSTAFVIVSGQVYQSTGASPNINQMPPNATYWTAVGTNQGQFLSDPSQMHVYSHLVLPYSGQAGISGSMAQQPTFTSNGPISGSVQDPSLGLKMSFYDGLWCNTAGFWGPNVLDANFQSGGPSYNWLCDAGHLALWMAAGNLQSLNVDYIKVMQ